MTNTSRTIIGVLALITGITSACGSHTESVLPSSTVLPTATSTVPTTTAPNVDRLSEALRGAGATNLVAYTPETDPNRLQGRPGAYTDLVAFDLPGRDATGAPSIARGGDVEIFADPADLARRVQYLDSVIAKLPTLTEYHFVHGLILVRITGALTPDAANKVRDAVQAL